MSEQPSGWWGKAFDRFFPWLVTAVIAVAGFGGWFERTNAQAAGAAVEVVSLRGEVKELRTDLFEVKLAIKELTTELKYVGGPSLSSQKSWTPPRARPRQFDH